jgi:hypothetical protein
MKKKKEEQENNTKYHKVGTGSKFNRKPVKTEINTSNTQIHDRSLSCLFYYYYCVLMQSLAICHPYFSVKV